MLACCCASAGFSSREKQWAVSDLTLCTLGVIVSVTTASTVPAPRVYRLLRNGIISATQTSGSYSHLPGSDLVTTLSCPVTVTVRMAGMGKQGMIGGLPPSIPPAEWLYPGVRS